MSEEDRKKLVEPLANHVLKVWAVTQHMLREPKPDWLALASILDDEVEALRKEAASVRARG